MPAKRFRADIEVKASIAVGWRVLTDLAAYPEWNPMLRQVTGEPVLNAKWGLRVAKKLGSNETIGLPAKVRVCLPEKELAWGGGVPGVLDVHHYCRLQATPNGFRLIHGEDFTGLLVPVLWPVIGKRVRHENYVALNEAFRTRCEAVMQAS